MYVPKPKKLPSGRWFIQLRLNGKSVPVTADDKRECIDMAMAIKAKWRIEKRSIEFATKKTYPTLQEILDHYIDSKSNVLSPSTIRGYRIIQRNQFGSLMNCRADELNRNLQCAVNEAAAKYSPKTIKNAVALIKSAILQETGIKLMDVQLPASIKSVRAFLQPEEIEKFVEKIMNTGYAVPALLALSSLRMSEIAALRWEEIDPNADFIKVEGAVVRGEDNRFYLKKQNKNISSSRNVPIIIPQLREAIQRDKKEKGPILISQSGLREAVHAACRDAGITDVTVHGLRHSFASLCYHLKVPEQIVMEIGGWSDIGTMRRVYTHIAQTDIAHYNSELQNFFKKDH